MLSVLDRTLQVPSKEPAVIMAIVGIYKLAFSNAKLGLTKEVIAHKVLPFLIPLSIENGLTVKQYDSITSLVREMLTRLETEHRTKASFIVIRKFPTFPAEYSINTDFNVWLAAAGAAQLYKRDAKVLVESLHG